MLTIGQVNSLTVLEVGAHGAILDGGQWGRLLLPLLQLPSGLEPGAAVEVFVYLDAEGDPVPTTQRAAAAVGEVAWLEVVDVNRLGAFADWGIPKDLFIPYAEQQYKLSKGRHTLVRVYQDKQGRLAGSTRLDHWIRDDASGLRRGQKVSLIIADKTELGFKAVINHRCWGLLYGNELYRRVRKGQVIDGYVRQIREDGKVDLSLTQPGFSEDKMNGISTAILEALDANDGFLALTDKSPPPEIYAAFGVSKKVFKQALGALYKQRRIQLEKDGIRRV
ncbi:CvfB family protein [Parahaliea aestuarii]|uniref:GntR family transcriptional regulator n=1 Tax=Parahaliea aestuarii TaxID=1852021 RepID=A0A5C9A0L2_9GAMM|nr:S1-like domain-containing RNA-binding protein [Parahaliea aestuarii]TXS93599.1 GntR family transcriptional regulator [Parahaliea aestuarii]